MTFDVQNGATGAVNGIEPTPQPPVMPEPTQKEE